MSDQPPGGYQPPQPPQPPQYQPPPQAPPQPAYQPPPAGGYQAAPGYQQPGYQQPAGGFQPVNPAPSSSNGCLKAFLIVLAISTVLGIIVVIASIVLVGSAVDQVAKSFGVADTKDYEIKFDEGSCKIDDSSQFTTSLKAAGTLTNKSGHKQAYNFEIEFVDNDNTVIGSSFPIITSGLSDGQKYAFDVDTTATGSKVPDQVKCKVKEVNYWPT